MKFMRFVVDRFGGGRIGCSGVVFFIIMIIMFMIVVFVMVVIMVRFFSIVGSSSVCFCSCRIFVVLVIIMGFIVDGSCRRWVRIDRGGFVVFGGRSGFVRVFVVLVVVVRFVVDVFIGRWIGVVLSEGEREEGYGGKGGEG